MDKASVSKVNKEPKLWFPDSFRLHINTKLDEQAESTGCSEANTFITVVLNELVDSNNKNHLITLKKVSKNIQSASLSSSWNIFLDVLITGLFYNQGNHTVALVVKSIIRNLPEDSIKTVSDIVEEKFLVSEATCDHIDMNGVDLVYAMLSSKFGEKVIVTGCQSVFRHFRNQLAKLISNINQNKSTTEIAQLYSGIHTVVRTLLSILKFEEIAISQQDDQQFLNLVFAIYNLGACPPEVQVNCLGCVLLMARQGHDHVLHFIQKITNSNETSSGIFDELDDSPKTKLNLCLALLSNLKIDGCVAHDYSAQEGSLVGGIILPVVLHSKNQLNDPSLSVLTARLMEQWMEKCLLCLESTSSPLVSNEWSAARDELLELTLNCMEHQNAFIRHSAKNAFESILKIHLLIHKDGHQILKTIQNMPRFKKAKYIALSCLARTKLVALYLEMEPNIAEELLNVSNDVALANQATEVFNMLMLRKIDQSDSWVKHWLNPLLNAMEHHQSQSFESSLVELLKLYPDLVWKVEFWFEQDPSARLSVYLVALLACRRFGLIPSLDSNSSRDLWNNIVKTEILQQALEHSEGKLRLSAFGILIEGPKTTQLFSAIELDWIRQFITRDICNPNAAFRQQFSSHVKKLLYKLRDSGSPLTVGDKSSDRVETVTTYRIFLAWLVNKCLMDIGPGSSFPRRFLSLHFLKLIQDAMSLNIDPRGLTSEFPTLTISVISSLVDCFFDSYDVNKELALDLLQSQSLLSFMDQEPDNVKDFYWATSFSLSQSLRSTDTVAAAFFFRWLTLLTPTDNILQQRNDHPLLRSWLTETSNTVFVIGTMTQQLEGQLEGAKGNLRRLAVDAPIYGLLSSVRFLLSDTHCHRPGDIKNDHWATLLTKIIEICFQASSITLPVVASDSPEGFLPERNDNSSTSTEIDVSAQALLVCAWRTIREVALIFGHLSSFLLISNYRLLPSELIHRMGQHLKQLLLEVKHRGAFEQVYCGFSQFCNSLWRSSIVEFHQLPTIWLLQLITDLEDSSLASKLCATRRSAGLPFMFQAILSPEVELSPRTELLSKAMESLLSIAAKGETECRIHSLNILRTLYRESRLNQVIGPYVCRGMMLAIDGFDAAHWPERNSSTLLFSALMNRIFGVPRLKADYQKRNSLTGRVFFQLFPELYPFLLERLRSKVEAITRNEIELHPSLLPRNEIELHPSLFPMLVLLGRLHPPACENTGSGFQLLPFISLIRSCGSSSVLKTRKLSAQALTPLLTPTAFVELLQELMGSISKSITHNQLHGTLIQIRHFIEDVPQLSATMRDQVFGYLKEKIPGCKFLLKSPCYTVRYEYVLVLELIHVHLELAFQYELHLICMQELRCCSAAISQPFYPLFCQRLAHLVFVGNPLPTTSEITELLNHPLEEVRIVVMAQLNQANSILNIDEGLRTLLEEEISNDENTHEYRSMALSTLSRHCKSLNHYLPWTLKLYQSSSSDVMLCAALDVCGNAIRCGKVDDIQPILEWSGYLFEATQSKIQFRLMAVQLLTANYYWLSDEICKFSSKEHIIIVTNLWACLLNCLMDDDESVRLAACTVVSKITKEDKWKQIQSNVTIEAALDYFVNRIGCVFPLDVVLTLVKMVIANSEEEEESESQSFEKDETNSFLEPMAHSLLMSRYIERCIKKNTISASDIPTLIEPLERYWKRVENFDLCHISDCQSFMNRRRSITVFVLDLLYVFVLTGSLKTVDTNILAMNQRAHNLFQTLPNHVVTYSVQNWFSS